MPQLHELVQSKLPEGWKVEPFEFVIENENKCVKFVFHTPSGKTKYGNIIVSEWPIPDYMLKYYIEDLVAYIMTCK